MPTRCSATPRARGPTGEGTCTRSPPSPVIPRTVSWPWCPSGSLATPAVTRGALVDDGLSRDLPHIRRRSGLPYRPVGSGARTTEEDPMRVRQFGFGLVCSLAMAAACAGEPGELLDTTLDTKTSEIIRATASGGRDQVVRGGGGRAGGARGGGAGAGGAPRGGGAAAH